MARKELLYLDLNYAHRLLSPGFRIQSLILGLIFVLVGVVSLLTSSGNTLNHSSSILNMVAGLVALYYSSRRLTWFMRKYISITDDSIRLKMSTFFPRKKFNWNDVEQIEISRENIRIWTDEASEPVSVSVRSVSYDDYQVLHKLIVDVCMEKNIDMV